MTPGLPLDEPTRDSFAALSALDLKRDLRGTGELALLDVREPREFSDGHPLFATSLPFSRFEPELLRLVPNPTARVVLIDDGSSGRARRAASMAATLGYGDIAILVGGTEAWRAAGYTLFEGEHVPSKAFGELLLEAHHVPTIAPAAFDARRRAGERFILLDGRPLAEHRKMCIPGSICLPNGDLAYRIGLAVGDEAISIVVHCAGRTRSILGAQTLRELGLKNPVAALEDGTQGWMLAGLALEHGSERHVSDAPDAFTRAEQQMRARELAARWAVPSISASDLQAMIGDRSRTTYLLDVRSPEEYAAQPAAAIQNAPGGQLVQATDRWLAVRGARLVLVDDNEIRATVTAHWLRQIGWDAAVLHGGSEAWPALAALPSPRASFDHGAARHVDTSRFMPDRHAGNRDHARGYLAWEKGLVARLDADERAAFRITADAPQSA
jgi:rhodanese-related sulfurtransferase